MEAKLKQQIQQLRLLASLTIAETLRQPVCLLLTLCSIVFTIAVPLIASFTFGDGRRLATESGLAFQFMFGIFIGGYAACGALERDQHSGTTVAILSKPVSRIIYFLAKFAGIAIVLALFSACSCLATMLAERIAERYSIDSNSIIDYQTATLALLCPTIACIVGAIRNATSNRAFPLTAQSSLFLLLLITAIVCGFFSRNGDWSPYDPQFHWPILQASLLVMLGLIMLASMALTLAPRLRLAPTAAICILVLLLGLASDYAFARIASPSNPLSRLLYAVIPNWQHFWAADLITNSSISLRYLMHALLYASLYTTGIICIGSAIFKRQEIS